MAKYAFSSLQEIRDDPYAPVARFMRKSVTVVICEADDGSWCELDAESVEHGRLLARTWVDPERGHGRGASVWSCDERWQLKDNLFSVYETVGA